MMNQLISLLALSSLWISSAYSAEPASGKVVFDRWCMGCHEAFPGRGFDPPAGTYTLQQRYQGKLPAEIEKRTDLTADYVRTLVRRGINVMPASRKTEITDKELDDLLAYLIKPSN